MFKVVKRIHFCYGHRLLDYEGKCARPHGHNAVAEVELAGEELDPVGMLVDFGEIEKALAALIEEKIDHRMLLREDDPLVGALRSVGEEPYVMAENPTAEEIARLIFREAAKSRLPVVAVRLWETFDAYSEYSASGENP